jgi:glycosyl transferase family 2
MSNPTVSFIIPCYRLAHLLGQCIESILQQTYEDFEILVMDDCSPDETQQVVSSFHDPRIRYVRNEKNIGHLRNYNKGIELSRGRYIWLISADDYLRRPYLLDRYVETMDKNSGIGYCCCPAVAVRGGAEKNVIEYSVYDTADRIVPGREFLKTLLYQNIVMAPSVLARRECYDKVSVFPLDACWAGEKVEMGWVGDWYLWCMFALSFDVAYFAEPMVCYRVHDLSMTTQMTEQDTVMECAAADIAVPWMVKAAAADNGSPNLQHICMEAIAGEYARHARGKEYRSATSLYTVEQFEASLCRSTQDEKEREFIRARFLAAMGDRSLLNGDALGARQLYIRGLRKDAGMGSVYIKLVLLSLGKIGTGVRQALRSYRVKVRRGDNVGR